MKDELTQEIVRELLDYNQDTGELIWKFRDRRWFKSDHDWKSWNTRFAGQPAFMAKNGHGYLTGKIFGMSYRSHRIIWLWMTGEWPDPEVDHENHNRSDNRWKNLFEKNCQGNSQNQSLHRNNTSGQVGVCKIPEGWRMRISDNEKRKQSRSLKTYEEAVVARKEAERKYGYHKNHGEKKRAA